jgi:hypothetical protein
MLVLKRIGAAAAATLILLAPALWNGFPLLQYDTGGYLARWYEGTLELSRSTVYGLFLNLLTRPDFWPAALVQAVATVWIFSLVLRVYGFGEKARVLVVTVGMLSVFTTLPWVVDVLITDIFAALAVLALHLSVLHADVLRRWERVALFVFIAFATATHSATLAVLLALLAAGLLAACYDRRRVPFARLAHGVAALAFGATMLVAANYVVAGRLAWTPGGIALTFGRMLDDGIVRRYLDDRCPDPRFKLCEHRQELPDNADVFFWSNTVFNQLGRFDGLHDEMQTIVLESLRDYPALQLKAALKAFAVQLVRVGTGYGVNTDIWHSYGMIENFVPAAYPAMKAARQQRGELVPLLAAINRVHLPVAFASMLLLLAVIALGLARARFADLGRLAVTAALAILANAFVFGVLSGPHNRYGARMVWIAAFVVLLVPWRACWRKTCDERSAGQARVCADTLR